jgi:hypothetical protein
MSGLGILSAFFGGALGVAFGGVNIFIITGIVAIVAVAVDACGLDFSLTSNLAFGAFLGPQITFSAPSVTARYAMKKGWLKSGKDMGVPMVGLGHPSLLVFGGCMGIVGYIINYFWGTILPGKIDTPAATIFTMCLISKIVFEGNPFGKETEEVKKAGGRYALSAPASWLPWLTYAPQKLMMGLAAGGSAAYLTYIAKGTSIYESVPALVFGIGALLTLFLIVNESVPIPPYMMISAAYAVIASGNNIWWGIFFGIVGAFLADFLTKTFYVFGDSHMDPPGMTITCTSFLILGILPNTGIYNVGSWLPISLIALYIIYTIIQYTRLKKIGCMG